MIHIPHDRTNKCTSLVGKREKEIKLTKRKIMNPDWDFKPFLVQIAPATFTSCQHKLPAPRCKSNSSEIHPKERQGLIFTTEKRSN